MYSTLQNDEKTAQAEKKIHKGGTQINLFLTMTEFR